MRRGKRWNVPPRELPPRPPGEKEKEGRKELLRLIRFLLFGFLFRG
jgi:hypothetical protein